MIAHRPSRGHVPLPTIICSWCKQVLRVGAPKVSHGICAPCAAIFFGRSLPERS
jgi:hypothetical protein